MNKKFWTRICSDLDYEEMTADVCYENHTVATITQEEGIENMKIQIYNPQGDIQQWNFRLDDFLAAIQATKNKLITMQKIPETDEEESF